MPVTRFAGHASCPGHATGCARPPEHIARPAAGRRGTPRRRDSAQ
ncbi:hypothetical protein GSH07_27030 [Burkholderia pseudomallei]|nr:hypothetical protein [Burkholderia pseudomallei]